MMYVIWAALAFAAIQVSEYSLFINSNQIVNCCPGYYSYVQGVNSFGLCLVWETDEPQSKGPKHLNTERLN